MYSAVVSGMYDLCARTELTLAGGWNQQEIVEALKPAIEVQGRSRFLQRLRQWPRGYPGDFETIEYMMDGHNGSTAGTVEFFCEEFFLNSPPAFQHRNKLLAQAEAISAFLGNKTTARILVLGCGGGRDLLMAREQLATSSATLVLCDLEEDALRLCALRMTSPGTRVTLIPGNIFQNLATLQSAGPFDLILAGGLFDYIPDTLLRRYLPRIHRDLMAADSLLFFTNIAAGNPYRIWMEIFGNWTLIHRSEAELRILLERSGFHQEAILVRREATRLAYLVEARRGT